MCPREVSRAGSGRAASTPAQDQLSRLPGRGERATRFSPGPTATAAPRPEKQRPSEASSQRDGPNLSPRPSGQLPSRIWTLAGLGQLEAWGTEKTRRPAQGCCVGQQPAPRAAPSPHLPHTGPRRWSQAACSPPGLSEGAGIRGTRVLLVRKSACLQLPQVILSSRPHFTPGDVSWDEEGLTTHQPRQSRQRAVSLVHSSHPSPTPKHTTSATPGLARPLQRRLLYLKCPLRDSRAPSQADLLPGLKETTGFPVSPWRSTRSPLHTPSLQGTRGPAWASSPGPEEPGSAHPSRP